MAKLGENQGNSRQSNLASCLLRACSGYIPANYVTITKAAEKGPKFKVANVASNKIIELQAKVRLLYRIMT